MKTDGWHDEERRKLVRALNEGGCLLCRDKDAAQHHWCTWYVMETHREPDYRRRVARNGGFCAPHTRLLMTSSDGVHVLPALFGDLVSSALAGVTYYRCDACAKMTAAVGRRLGTVVRWLDDPEVLAGAGRLCTQHLLDVLETAPWQLASTLTALASGQPDTPPSDPDLPIRAAHLATAVDLLVQQDKQLNDESTVERVRAGLDRSCCPVCRARAQGGLRYTSWLLDQDLDRLDPGESALCPAHLGDATALDPRGAGRIAEVLHRSEQARLAQLADRLAATPQARMSARLRAAWPPLTRGNRTEAAAALRRPERFVAEALRNFRHNEPSCATCAASELAERRELALLEAAAHHSTVRERWTHGHGLCRDHAPRAAPEVATQVLRSRLALLGWELDETRRKRAWRTRHEPATPAETSWPRAIPFLCGDAYLGLTATEFHDQDNR
ncbi:hypothetical protein GCM10022222_59090 [Amycolatopsis ultiminotia]|uniref:Uncharacterized protein n=1 Tax=Amycolatopsis ultiminotia TaxID=543629 RepID=A0ABP6XIB3_9PSEU